MTIWALILIFLIRRLFPPGLGEYQIPYRSRQFADPDTTSMGSPSDTPTS